MTTTQSINQPIAIANVLLLGIAGVFMFLVLPILVGAIAKTLQLSDQQIGLFASADLFGFFLGSASSMWWARKINWKYGAIASLCIIIVSNFLSIQFLEVFSSLLFLRVISGIGQGAVVSIYSAHVSDTFNPEKYYAYFLVLQTITASLSLWLLPALIDRTGCQVIWTIQIVLCFLALLGAILFQPTNGLRRESPLNNKNTFNWQIPTLGLVAFLFFYIGQGAVWTHLELIGNSFDLDSQFIGRSLSLAMIGAFAGSSLASVVELKWGRKIPLFLTAILQPLSLVLLFSNLGNWSFISAIIIFTFFWNFCLPYLIGILIKIDSSGRAILGANPTFALGVSLAPIFVAQFNASSNYSVVIWLASGAVVLSVGLFIYCLSSFR